MMIFDEILGYWEKIKEMLDKKTMIMALVGFVSALLVLVLTLNILSATMVLVLSVVGIIFNRSYSWGWLVLLAIILLFPAVTIGSGIVLLFDVLLALLGIIGLIKIANDQLPAKGNHLSLHFFVLTLIGFSTIFFGHLFVRSSSSDVWILTFSILFIWVTLISFKYYFQTLRRLRKFFAVIIFVGLAHSIFGLAMFMGGWQTSSGLGTNNIKSQHFVFNETRKQVNGFLGTGLALRMKSNALTPLLMISVPLTAGYYLVTKRRRRGLLGKENDQTVQPIASSKSFWQKIFQIAAEKENVILVVLAIQLLVFFLTFSYNSIVFMAIGFMVFGILDRNKGILTTTAGLILVFSLIFPEMNRSVSRESVENISNWLKGISEISHNWFMGSGWKLSSDSGRLATNAVIHNSYLFVWNIFGIVGLLTVVSMVVQYFQDIIKGYKRSDGEKRIWIMTIIAIFIGFVLESLTNNALFFGPAALVFWLLYACQKNLRQKEVVFGITETKFL